MTHESPEKPEGVRPPESAIDPPEGGTSSDDLLETLYDELRGLAKHLVSRERKGLTLTPTALVHEAYLRLSTGVSRPWQDDRHFYLVAAQAMRRILVERARAKGSRKRGGDRNRVPIEIAEPALFDNSPDFVSLDEALSRLAEGNKRASQVVLLRFFAGLEIDETAKMLGVSKATAVRDWTYARAWLYDALRDESP